MLVTRLFQRGLHVEQPPDADRMFRKNWGGTHIFLHVKTSESCPVEEIHVEGADSLLLTWAVFEGWPTSYDMIFWLLISNLLGPCGQNPQIVLHQTNNQKKKYKLSSATIRPKMDSSPPPFWGSQNYTQRWKSCVKISAVSGIPLAFCVLVPVSLGLDGHGHSGNSRQKWIEISMV